MDNKSALEVLASVAEPSHQHTNESGAAAHVATNFLIKALKLDEEPKPETEDEALRDD